MPARHKPATTWPAPPALRGSACFQANQSAAVDFVAATKRADWPVIIGKDENFLLARTLHSRKADAKRQIKSA